MLLRQRTRRQLLDAALPQTSICKTNKQRNEKHYLQSTIRSSAIKRGMPAQLKVIEATVHSRLTFPAMIFHCTKFIQFYTIQQILTKQLLNQCGLLYLQGGQRDHLELTFEGREEHSKQGLNKDIGELPLFLNLEPTIWLQ